MYRVVTGVHVHEGFFSGIFQRRPKVTMLRGLTVLLSVTSAVAHGQKTAAARRIMSVISLRTRYFYEVISLSYTTFQTKMTLISSNQITHGSLHDIPVGGFSPRIFFVFVLINLMALNHQYRGNSRGDSRQ